MQRSRTGWRASMIRDVTIVLLAVACGTDTREVRSSSPGAGGTAPGGGGTPPASNAPSGDAPASSGNVASNAVPSGEVPPNAGGANGMNAQGGAGAEGVPSGAAGAGAGSNIDGAAGAAGGGAEDLSSDEVPCAPRVAAPTIVTTDEVLEAVALDLAAIPDGDQMFTRYVALTNRSNAGVPECELEEERDLLAQVLRTAAARMGVPPPAAVDARQLILRIDIRDYAYERAINVNGFDFSDSWNAITLSSPFGVQFAGEAADAAIIATTAPVPFLYANALIEQILAGVPPAALAPQEALRADPVSARTLTRLQAPVTAADVAGDLGISSAALSAALPQLVPDLQPLGAGGTVTREVYAPLFLQSLCALPVNRANVPDSFQCES